MKIQLLKDAISYLTSKAKSILSAEQKQLYLRINNGNTSRTLKLRQEQFANVDFTDEKKRIRPALKLTPDYDLSNPLVIDHLSPASARHIWDYEDHVFLNLQDCLRIGLFFGLDLYHCLVLVLKGQWEKFYSNEYQTIIVTEIDEKYYDESLKKALINAIKYDFQGKLRRKFREKISQQIRDIYDLFEEHGSLVTQVGYELNTFSNMVKDCLNEQLYLGLINAPEIDDFTEAKKKEMRLLLEGNNQETIKYLEAKKRWGIATDELLDALYILDSRKIFNKSVRTEFCGIFGNLYWQLRQLEQTVDVLETKIQLKLEKPELDVEEINKVLQDQIKAITKTLEDLAKEITLSKVYTEEWEILDEALIPMQQDEIEAYFSECKRVFREISLKVHPNFLEHNDDWVTLEETQKERIQEIYAEVLTINREELISNNKLISYRKRSLARLQRAAFELDNILKMLGIMLNIYQDKEFEAQETITDKIAWFESESNRLNEVTKEVTQELQALSEDSDILEWEQILKQKNHYEEIKTSMAGQIEVLADKAKTLEDKFTQLFA